VNKATLYTSTHIVEKKALQKKKKDSSKAICFAKDETLQFNRKEGRVPVQVSNAAVNF
jgi:hypothetical protein